MASGSCREASAPATTAKNEAALSIARSSRGGFAAGYAADDGAALHFEGVELREVVATRPTATGYRVERGSETALPARVL